MLKNKLYQDQEHKMKEDKIKAQKDKQDLHR